MESESAVILAQKQITWTREVEKFSREILRCGTLREKWNEVSSRDGGVRQLL